MRHVLCVSGGVRGGDASGQQAWTPIRVEDVDGKTAFSVSSREAWISNHCFGKHTKETHMVTAIQAVVGTIKRQLERPPPGRCCPHKAVRRPARGAAEA